MTLYELITKILEIAKSKPNINSVFEGDIYELINLPNIDYSVFYITQGSHSIEENTAQYTLNLFYVDRLTENFDNRLLIQSNGIDAITNVLNELDYTQDIDLIYPLTFTPFNQRFADDCAGVFCTVTINTDANLGICNYD